MKIVQCPHCKVRYRESSLACPICNKKADGSPAERGALHAMPASGHWKRALLVIVFIVLFIPSMLVLTSDYIYSRAFTWSPLVVVIIIFTYGYFCCLTALYKHKLLLCMSLIVTTLAFLFTLNISMNTHWFSSIALPITVLWVTLAYIAFMWITKPSMRGFSIVGIVLFLIAIALLGTDLVISYEIRKTLSISWSLISAGSIIPLAAVMFYVQKHKNTIDRWLHL